VIAVRGQSLLTPSGLREYRDRGHVVVRQVFSRREMAELAGEAERLLTDCRDLISPHNLRCRYMPHVDTGERLFEVFDPICDVSPTCARFACDPRIGEILELIYGEAACLFKDKLIFKPPGALGYDLHQDIPLSWEVFPRSFVTVLIPIDRSTRENGCTEVYSGYHGGFLCDDPAIYMLPDHLVDDGRRVPLELEPGDVAVFHGLTPHRSAPNRSPGMRRTLYVSYNAASDGGDQRDDHYTRFHAMLRGRLPADTAASTYFR
jgi:hypothetical protein